MLEIITPAALGPRGGVNNEEEALPLLEVEVCSPVELRGLGRGRQEGSQRAEGLENWGGLEVLGRRGCLAVVGIMGVDTVLPSVSLLPGCPPTPSAHSKMASEMCSALCSLPYLILGKPLPLNPTPHSCLRKSPRGHLAALGGWALGQHYTFLVSGTLCPLLMVL